MAFLCPTTFLNNMESRAVSLRQVSLRNCIMLSLIFICITSIAVYLEFDGSGSSARTFHKCSRWIMDLCKYSTAKLRVNKDRAPLISIWRQINETSVYENMSIAGPASGVRGPRWHLDIEMVFWALQWRSQSVHDERLGWHGLHLVIDVDDTGTASTCCCLTFS